MPGVSVLRGYPIIKQKLSERDYVNGYACKLNYKTFDLFGCFIILVSKRIESFIIVAGISIPAINLSLGFCFIIGYLS